MNEKIEILCNSILLDGYEIEVCDNDGHATFNAYSRKAKDVIYCKDTSYDFDTVVKMLEKSGWDFYTS